MEAKAKAIELLQDTYEANLPYSESKEDAVNLSIKFIDCIIKTDETREFWQEVKEELLKL